LNNNKCRKLKKNLDVFPLIFSGWENQTRIFIFIRHNNHNFNNILPSKCVEVRRRVQPDQQKKLTHKIDISSASFCFA